MPFPTIAGPVLLRLEADSIAAHDGDTPTTWSDRSGGGHDAAGHGAVYRSSRFKGGLPGLLTGAGKYLDLGAPAALELPPTFELWAVVRLESTPPSAAFALAKDGESGPRGFGLGVRPDRQAYLEVGGALALGGAGPSLLDATGHVLRLKYDGSAWTMFVDGVPVGTAAGGLPATNTATPWNIGRRSYAGVESPFPGEVGVILYLGAEQSDADAAALQAYLAATWIDPAPTPPLLPATARISPGGLLLILKYLELDGVTPAAIQSVSGSATLTVNGAPLTLPTWLHWGHGTVAFALCGGSKYAKLIDDTDGGFAEVTGSWSTVANSGDFGEFYLPRQTAVGGGFVKSASSNAKATFTFTGCVAGPHTLSHMLWDRQDVDRTTDATYTVKDGAGTALKAYHLNLRYTSAADRIWPRFDRVFDGLDWIDFRDGAMFDPAAGNTFDLPAGQDTVVVEITNGTGTGTLVVDGLLLRNVLVPPARPGDVVTLDMDAGVVATADGPMPAVAARAVTFADDVDLMPYDPATPKTMELGYNKEGSAPNGIALWSADRGPFTLGWFAPAGSSFALDDLGEFDFGTPLVGQAERNLVQTATPGGSTVDARATVVVSDGDVFRIEFDWPTSNGPFDAAAQAGQTFACAAPGASVTKNDSADHPGGYQSLGGTRWRLWITMHWQAWTPASARAFAFYPWGQHNVTLVIDRIITGFAFYDAHVPLDWAMYAHPHLVALFKDRGLAGFRLMDVMATNGSTVSRWTDYYPVNASGRDRLPYRYAQAVTSVRAIDRSGADADGALQWFVNEAFHAVAVLRVATTAGLVTGMPLAIAFGDGANLQVPSNAGTPDGSIVTIVSPIIALIPGSSTEVLAYFPCSTGGPGPAPNTVAINPDSGDGSWPLVADSVLFAPQPGQHPELAARLCAELGVRPYYNIPHLAVDQYVRDWAAMAMSYAPPGTRISAEYSNEFWNFPEQQLHIRMQAIHGNYLHAQDPVANPRTFGLGYSWAAYRSDQLRQVAQAAFDAAGRPGDLYWVLGSQGGGSNVTQSMVEWGATQSPPVTLHFDALCIDTYRSFVSCEDHALVTSAASLDAFVDRLDLDGCIDLGALTTLDGGRATVTQAHRVLLDANGFGATDLLSYEGGWEILCGANAQGTVDNGVRWTQEISRSPRMYRLTLAENRSLDAMGYASRYRYTADYAGGLGDHDWCDFPWLYCEPGTGDPAENPHPWDYDGAAFGTPVASQTGGAWLAWAAAFLPTPTPTPGVKNPRWKRAIQLWHNARARRGGRRR